MWRTNEKTKWVNTHMKETILDCQFHLVFTFIKSVLLLLLVVLVVFQKTVPGVVLVLGQASPKGSVIGGHNNAIVCCVL